MVRKELFLLAVFLLLFSPSLYAEQASVIQADDVVVVFEEPLRFVANEAVSIYPTIKSDLETSFNWALNFRPTLVLTSNRQRFEELTGSRFVVAYAVPQSQGKKSAQIFKCAYVYISVSERADRVGGGNERKESDQ